MSEANDRDRQPQLESESAPNALDLGETWERHRKALLGFVMGQTFDAEHAEDILQDAYLLVVSKWSSYKPEKSVYGFFKLWTKVQILRFYRKQKRQCPPLLLDEIRQRSLDQEAELDPEDMSLEPLWSAEQPGPESVFMKIRAYDLFLRETMRVGGYPHQLICFGYTKLLDDWGPQTVVESLSPKELELLGRRLEEEYGRGSELRPDAIRSAFSPLRGSMAKALKALIDKRDKTTRDQLAALLHRRAGETVLQTYFSGNPEANVSDWTYKVARRAKEHLVRNYADQFLS